MISTFSVTINMDLGKTVLPFMILLTCMTKFRLLQIAKSMLSEYVSRPLFGLSLTK